MTTILTKKKDTSGAPAPGDLTNAAGGAELAVNTADKRLYTKDSGGNVVEIGTNPTILNIDNIQIDGSTISSTNTNGDINITPNGTGSVVVSKLNVTGAMTFDGNVTVGNSSADTLVVNSTITSNLLFTDNTYDIGASGANRPRSIFVGTNVTAANNITAVGQVIAGFGTYGSYSSQALMIGDSNYGFYVTNGNLLVKSNSGGQFSLMNSGGTSAAVTMDIVGNVAATSFSTQGGTATNSMLTFSGNTIQHGLGSSWTGQGFYIGGSAVGSMTSTGLAIGGVSPSTSLEGYKEVAFGAQAGSTIRASTKDNYGSSLWGYGFYVSNTADEVAQIACNYADSSGFGRGVLYFRVSDPTNGLVTRAMLSSTDVFTAGNSVDTYQGLVNNAQIVAISTADNNGLAVYYPTAPNGTAGGALNFWAANNTGGKNQGRIKLICTDGNDPAFSSDMVFYNAVSGSLTEWLRADRFGQVSSSKKLLMGSASATLSGANTRIFAGYGLGSENGVIVAGTQNGNYPGLFITNWTGSATTQGPRISFDNSGFGGTTIGQANGVNRFDICTTWNSPLISVLMSNGYTGFGTDNPNKRLVVASTTVNDADMVLQKSNSGTTNQGGQTLRFWNFGPANQARNDNVPIGEIYFGASQPTSGNIQDAAQIIVRADGSQSGQTTKSKMQFLTSTNANGGANTVAQVLYGDQNATFGTETQGGGRLTSYQSSKNSFVCTTNDGDNSSDYGIAWYIQNQGHTFARIRGTYVSSGGTGEGGVLIQTKTTGISLRDVFYAAGNGTIVFSTYGAGTLSTNSNGEISASDGRFKTKTRGLTDALSKVRQLANLSTYYRWNADSPWGKTSHEEEIGWIAQEVATVIPEASPEPESEDKFRNYHDRAILAYLTKALDDLASEFEAYKAAHP